MPRDARTFITVHDGITEHPKIERLSDRAFRNLIDLWCWCARNRTDGHVPDVVWRKRTTAKTRSELEKASLIHSQDDGVTMHDYLDHQRSADEIAALSAARKTAGQKGGRAKARVASATASARDGASGLLKQTASKDLAETETETEEEKTTSSPAAVAADMTPPRKRGTRIDPHLDADGKFPVTDDMRTWVAESCPLVRHPGRETEQFADYWSARTGKDATKLDWRKTWQTWMRNAQSRTERSIPTNVRTLRPGSVQR